MARQILVLRTDEHPCPFDDEGENAFTDEQIAVFLARSDTTSIVVCPHHEMIVMANMPAGYIYTHASAGQVKGVMHAADEAPVIPDAEPHTAPAGVSPAQAEAERLEWEAANPGVTGPVAGASLTDEVDVEPPA